MFLPSWPGQARPRRANKYQPAVRRGTKAVARNENTASPRWLVPVLRACRMPHSGRFSDVRLVSTWLEKRMVSPASTGLIQRNSRKPGDGPHTATFSPRATASAACRLPSATSSFMQTAATCQPDAASPPNSEVRPAASSRWKGCGSNCDAKRLMSSGVKVNEPNARRAPISMSSKNAMLRTRPVTAADDDRRFHLAQHLAARIADRTLEGDDAGPGAALRDARLDDVDVQRQIVARTQRRQPAHLVDAGRTERGGAADEAVEQHPHHQRAEVPARAGQAAEHR